MRSHVFLPLTPILALEIELPKVLGHREAEADGPLEDIVLIGGDVAGGTSLLMRQD